MRKRALAAIALLVASGCTSEAPERPEETPTPPETSTDTPTESPTPALDLSPALLTRAHLGPKFGIGALPDAPAFHTVFDDPDRRFGCLRALDALDFGVPPEGTELVSFDARNDAKTPHVVQLVGSAPTAEDAEQGFTQATALLRGCPKVRTRREGVKVDAPVRSNRHRALPVVDQQLNIRAVGTLRILRSSFPIGVWVSIVRIDRMVAIVSVLDLDQDDATAQRLLTEAAVRRLAAVVTGRPLPVVRRIPLEIRLPANGIRSIRP